MTTTLTIAHDIAAELLKACPQLGLFFGRDELVDAIMSAIRPMTERQAAIEATTRATEAETIALVLRV